MHTPDFPPAPPAGIESTAAEWLARCDRGLELTEQGQFLRWLAADPRHATAWRALQSTWSAFDWPRQSGAAEQMIQELTGRSRRRRRRRLVGATAAVAVAATLAVMFFVPAAGWRDSAPGAGIVVVQPERQQLVDGSAVELNRDTQIEVLFSPTRREVRLLRGEAHFTVAKDPSRPFVVTTPLAEVRAVGTAFAVGLRSDDVAVLVTEGTVALDRPAIATQASLPVPAGNAVVVHGGAAPDSPLQIRPVKAAEIERRLAWRASRLELSNARLADVVAALNRENHVQLMVSEPELAGLRFTGTFRADQPENFVRLLEFHYDVRTERSRPDVIVLHRAN